MLYPIYSVGAVTLSEIPGKTALVIEFNNCHQMCPGCHSPHLWEKTAEYSLGQVLEAVDMQVLPDINCILLMGGTTNGITMEDLRILVEALYKEFGIPVAVYSGCPEDELMNMEMLSWFGLEWLKTGDYRAELGGIENPRSNQKLYRKEMVHTLRNHQYPRVSYYWDDITEKLRKKKDVK